MNDLLLYIAILVVTYLCGMSFVIAMCKLFFPVKTKEEWLKAGIKSQPPPYLRVSRMIKVQDSIINQTGQLASSHGS